MTQFKSQLAVLCALLVAAPGMYSQSLYDRAPRLNPNENHWYSGFTKRFDPRVMAPISVSNSGRLDQLVMGGNLYLSLSDAIALAVENNIDVEVSRYGYLSADNALYGALSGGNGAPNLDPVLTSNLGWGHTSTLNTNTINTGGLTTITGTSRPYNFGIQQGFLTGGTGTLSFNNSTTSSNSPANTVNPNTSSSLGLQFSQPLLQGFGLAFNKRGIRIARNNIKGNDYQFNQQLQSTLNTVIAAYWNLVTAAKNVDVVQATLNQNRTLYEDNKKQLDLGTMAQIDVVTAEAQVTTSETNLLVAQTAVQQREVILKNIISRNGIASATLMDAHVIPTDTIQPPDVEPVQPIQDLVAKALDSRPELAQLRVQEDNSRITLEGVRNGLLPQLNVSVNLNNPAAAGSINSITNINPLTGEPTIRTVDPQLIGGYPTVLGQLFSRNLLAYTFAAQLNIPLRNRAAQSSYIASDINLRTAQLATQKEINQVRADVQNAQIAVTNALAQYKSAVKSRQLEEQVVDAEQKKYQLGASTTYNVILRQTDLLNARQAEVAALSTYALAKLQMDQATGAILENNNIIVDEAKNGKVSKAPTPIPALPPTR